MGTELENALAAQELAKQKREAHDKEILRLSEEAFALENAARQAEADALRTSIPAKEPEPITIHSPEHPLSRILGVTQPVVVSPEPTPACQADPVQLPPERRAVTPEEQQHIAGAFMTAGIRIQPLDAKNLLMIATPSEIEHALSQVSAQDKLSGRTAVIDAVTRILGESHDS